MTQHTVNKEQNFLRPTLCREKSRCRLSVIRRCLNMSRVYLHTASKLVSEYDASLLKLACM